MGPPVAGHQPRRRAGEIARSNAETLAYTGCDTSICRLLHQSIPVFHAITLPHVQGQSLLVVHAVIRPSGDGLLSVLYLAAAIVLEICGTTSLKLSEGFTRIGPAGAVVGCYAAGFSVAWLPLG